MSWSSERAELASQVIDMAVRHRLNAAQIGKLLDQPEKLIRLILRSWGVLGVSIPISHSARERSQS